LPAASLRRPVVKLALPEVEETNRQGARPLRVGLLGGSFNPAHEGHRYLSLQALHRLALDQVWWLVSPQNPLKPVAGMAPFGWRLGQARAVAGDPRIRVRDLEARFGTRYTVDTLERLATWRDMRFVWLLGADNLVQLPRWRRWREVLSAVPVAVFERSTYSYGALAGEAAVCFAAARVGDDRLHALVEMTPPAWAYIRLRVHPASSTAIRRATASPATGR
jgi:nicotinate-nucleotide adenylyltransferase